MPVGYVRGDPACSACLGTGVSQPRRGIFVSLEREDEAERADLNPRPAFRRVRDFQSRSFGRSDTSPRPDQTSALRRGVAAGFDTMRPGEVAEWLKAAPC